MLQLIRFGLEAGTKAILTNIGIGVSAAAAGSYITASVMKADDPKEASKKLEGSVQTLVQALNHASTTLNAARQVAPAQTAPIPTPVVVQTAPPSVSPQSA